jgi:hypothetical protein
MSLGKPVIAYCHGGLEEQFTAIFPAGQVAVGDVDSVIEKTAVISNGNNQPGSIGEFSLEKMLSSTLGVYRGVLI